jgi:hypothetical protein
MLSIFLKCESSDSTRLLLVSMLVAATIESAVGRSPYRHLRTAEANAIFVFKSTILNREVIMELTRSSATSLHRSLCVNRFLGRCVCGDGLL